MSPISKSLPLQQTIQSDHPTTDGTRVRTYLHLNGPDDVRDRIACALSARRSEIATEHFKYSPSKLAARCTGDWKGKRFFAKIVLADPYPIPARFSTPWEMSGGFPEPVRSASEQIEAEWEMAHKMRELSGGSSVPTPLGKSVPARTIVWDEASGTLLIRMLKKSRWKVSFVSTGASVLFQAGMWLRNVHETSRQSTEIIEMPALIGLVNDFMEQQRPKNGSPYHRIVMKILEESLLEIGGAGAFRVPVAFTHGDFCLSNLIGESAGCRLNVVDFELCAFRPICHDLFALVSDLRSQLLNPVVPKSVILSWEKSFWAGYGPISVQIRAFVDALALARIFYHHLYRLLTRRQRRGWIAGVNAQLYRTFLERMIITRRLDLPREFCPP